MLYLKDNLPTHDLDKYQLFFFYVFSPSERFVCFIPWPYLDYLQYVVLF